MEHADGNEPSNDGSEKRAYQKQELAVLSPNVAES
jgi:hypothetical protein